jgi:hypothetical protein
MRQISIRVAKFLHWLATPNTTLLLYQGLGPAMLEHHRRPTIAMRQMLKKIITHKVKTLQINCIQSV